MGQVNNFRPGPVQEYAQSQGPASKPLANETKVKAGANADTFTGPGIFTLDAEKPGNSPDAAKFKPVYGFTEEETLQTATKYFDQVASIDGKKETISREDLKSQIAQDEKFLKDASNWVGKTGTEVGEIFKRHNTLSNLEANFDNYAKNGEIDRKSLTPGNGANAKLSDDQKAKIEPLVDQDGKATDMFKDIAKAGPNSSGTGGNAGNDPQGTNIDSKDLDAAIENGNKPKASANDKAAANVAQGIKSDPDLMAKLASAGAPGGVFAEGGGFTAADVSRLLGAT